MKSRHFRKMSTKAGTPPGTLMHVGEQKIEHVRLTVVDYDDKALEEIQVNDINELFSYCDNPRSTWVNVDGVHDTEIIGRIGQHFDIHPLTLEDILNTNQRPKYEDYDKYLYIVLKMLRYAPDSRSVMSEQISLILTPNVLLSFQESEGDVFAGVRDRLHKGRGRIRSAGCGYLAYALLDAIVDHYFIILENIGLDIEELEEQVLSRPGPAKLKHLHELKREVLFLRKQIWPMRELVAGLSKESMSLIGSTTGVYLRDVYDHAIQAIETAESFRDLLAGLLDLYLSTLSYKMNEVMKVLTIMATIFIPITFIAGVYGMNFKYMPELEWPWGYGLVWGVMIVVAGAMIFYFKNKRWL